MIATVSVTRFMWNPLRWLFIVVISAGIVAVLCNFFDDDPKSESEISEFENIEGELIADEDVAIFARTYIKIWTKNKYKYIVLPFLFFAACLIILFVG